MIFSVAVARIYGLVNTKASMYYQQIYIQILMINSIPDAKSDSDAYRN